MKKLVLILVIAVLLCTAITTVIAKPIVTETITFSGTDMSSSPLRVGKQKDAYIWGRYPWRNYDGGDWYAKVKIIKEKNMDLTWTSPVTGETYVCTGIVDDIDYLTGGWVSFDSRSLKNVGDKTPLTDFRMDLKEESAPSESDWDYQIWSRGQGDINDLYAEKTEDGYKIVSNGYMFRTSGLVYCTIYGSDGTREEWHHFGEDLSWSFEALIA